MEIWWVLQLNSVDFFLSCGQKNVIGGAVLIQAYPSIAMETLVDSFPHGTKKVAPASWPVVNAARIIS